MSNQIWLLIFPFVSKEFLMGISTLNLNFVKAALSSRAKILKQNIDDKPSDKNVDKRVNEHGDEVVAKIRQEQKRLNSEEIELLVAGYKDGKSACTLAIEYGCHRVTVGKILKRHGHEVCNRTAQKKLDVDDVLAMYSKIYSIEDIAQKYDVSRSSVVRCLKSNGVELRGRWYCK